MLDDTQVHVELADAAAYDAARAEKVLTDVGYRVKDVLKP